MRLRTEIDRLKKQILALSAYVEESVKKSVESVVARNESLAREVVDGDPVIDQMEVDLEEECLKILALHQPVAIDLRYIIAILKINNDLERIGDGAVNIAERAAALCSKERGAVPFDLPRMANDVETMLSTCLTALIDMDPSLAYEVLKLDDTIDEMNRQTFKNVQAAIKAAPDKTECFIQYLSISRNLERIADLATNIAEDVIYMIEGKIIRHSGF
jgi:phosphate transport system protein